MYLIKRKDKLFTHVGLYIDEYTIFHYASKTNDMFSTDQDVRISPLSEFSNGRKIFKIELDENIDLKTIYQRAQVFKNNGRRYNILTNNCISFVLSCLYGKSKVSIYSMFKGMMMYKIQPFGFVLK